MDKDCIYLGVVMLSLTPIRILWWKRYFPNGYEALKLYQKLTKIENFKYYDNLLPLEINEISKSNQIRKIKQNKKNDSIIM